MYTFSILEIFVFCRLSSSWKEKGDEGGSRDGEEDRNDETQGEIETTKNEERIEIKTIMSDFTSAQTQLHARIVACETENALLLLYFSIMNNIHTHSYSMHTTKAILEHKK